MKIEQRYDFRKDLNEVHKNDRFPFGGFFHKRKIDIHTYTEIILQILGGTINDSARIFRNHNTP